MGRYERVEWQAPRSYAYGPYTQIVVVSYDCRIWGLFQDMLGCRFRILDKIKDFAGFEQHVQLCNELRTNISILLHAGLIDRRANMLLHDAVQKLEVRIVKRLTNPERVTCPQQK